MCRSIISNLLVVYLKYPPEPIVSQTQEAELQTTPLHRSNVASPSASTFYNTQDNQRLFKGITTDYGLPLGHTRYQDVVPNVYQIIDSLGHGSLGVVEEVRVAPQYKSFVRKRVQIPHSKRQQYLKILESETKVLHELDHNHIVKILGTYSEVPDSGRQFYSILMVPVGQQDLKAFLEIVGDKSTTHSPGWYEDRKAWLRSWFKCLSSALAYIHGQGVRHQDIKPSNIIHKNGDIYFTDFSSASQFEIGQTTSTENPARTSAMYAAPEVIDNEEDLTRHGRGTDVFALGIVFTEMLAVLRGSSIGEYHQFLHDPGRPVGNKAAMLSNRQALLYGRKLAEIETCFSENSFFTMCIAPMLRRDRDQRPAAMEVARQVRNYPDWTFDDCDCDATVLEDDKDDSEVPVIYIR